ncbi:MAG: NAD(P)-dependent glycerol-3-phosphate dehydrogenase [Cyanobacteria bacterium NC_groundwater_1444_Ag_S-0.65um_54_12]|nr:NAD(P)-dependent glycerol-3-phosphate dehydrogenase [Cyanobacteria bacterium NC_groundwater_1444_Ag_S-0.65um_54_12]
MGQNVVGVVGGGSWGTAIAQILGDNGHTVRFWMRDAEVCRAINQTRRNSKYLPQAILAPQIIATTELASIGPSCRVIFLVVPSHGLRAVARELGDHLDGAHILIHAVKGIEPGTYKLMSQILREETCCRKIGVLSGPNLAKEVALHHPSATAIASRFAEVIEAGRNLLWCHGFRVYGNDDVVGTEIGGSAKNVMAIAAGMAQGLGFGMNTMALLLTRGLTEIARLGLAKGADAQTFQGLSGIGDLMATCFSPLSRNYQIGWRLAKGEALPDILSGMTQVAEGVRTTRTLHELARTIPIYMPITAGVYRILFEKEAPKDVLESLLDVTRNVYEFESAATIK